MDALARLKEKLENREKIFSMPLLMCNFTGLPAVLKNAGLDVFEDETKPLDERLTSLSHVVLTPHVAWNTDLAVDALYEEVAANVARYLRGERPESIVNGL